MSTYIPSDEIKQPSFHADELGFVFTWNGHLLRGIFPDATKQARGYFESGFVEKIVNKGFFPKTWISDFENEQFGMIIEHEIITPVIFATEWNFQMLKDAALMVLDIAQIAWKYGYTMIDCHKLNVLFYKNKPLYVDLGSFIPLSEGVSGWRPFSSFLRSYYYILDVWRSGAPQMAKRMMSPHVELSEKDYYSFKFSFFRRHDSFLGYLLKVRKMLCVLANTGDGQLITNNRKNKVRIIFLLKKIINCLKLAPSQHINKYKRRIKRMNLKSNSLKLSSEKNVVIILENVLNSRFPSLRNVAFINNKSHHFYDLILQNTNVDSIYSIQEEEWYSVKEYAYYKDSNTNIACLNYKLIGGEILLRNKFPEDRFLSDLVVIPNFKIEDNAFGLHNSLVFIDSLMRYSTTKTIILLTGLLNKDLMEKIEENFCVELYQNNIACDCVCLIVKKR